MTRQLLIAALVLPSILACSHRTLTGTDTTAATHAQAPHAQAPHTQSPLAQSPHAQSHLTQAHFTQAHFTQAQRQWLQAALRNYDYATTVMCYCTEDYIRAMRVNVRAGQVASAQYLDNGSQVPEKVRQSLRTIEQWFAYIDKGLRKPYFLLDVEYHAQLGYPVRLQADVRQQVADDERTVRIWDLVPETGNE